jgi:hypothetical protein
MRSIREVFGLVASCLSVVGAEDLEREKDVKVPSLDGSSLSSLLSLFADSSLFSLSSLFAFSSSFFSIFSFSSVFSSFSSVSDLT